MIINTLLIIFGKLFSKLSQLFNLGNGSTWPGHIALTINKHFVRDLLARSAIKTIVIAGTNGKTTTAKLIRTALEANGKRVMQNQSGANLLNGIASTLILATNSSGKLAKDFAIFEVDENSLPLFIKEVKPNYLLLLNLFRDQLDRYGEINTIAQKWQTIPTQTTLILNADDPQISYIGKNHEKSNTFYFGLNQTKNEAKNSDNTADSNYCPNCGEKLIYTSRTYSHLGIWHCAHCKLQRPKPDITDFVYYPLPGEYNRYNTLAAVLVLKKLALSDSQIEQALRKFQPAFGRQETIVYKNKNVQLFLSKNPTSFNQSYETMRNLGAKHLLLILNDRIPDGRDVSWIWDVDFPGIKSFKQVFIAGDRVYDMALRIKYDAQIDDTKVKTFEDLKTAIDTAIDATDKTETLFILPTYSAMLDARKILTGKKIL